MTIPQAVHDMNSTTTTQKEKLAMEKTITSYFYKVTPFSTCDLVFVQTTLEVPHIEQGYDEDEDDYDDDNGYIISRAAVIHNVHSLTLDSLAQLNGKTRESYLDAIEKEIFDVFFDGKDASELLSKLVYIHTTSTLVHNVADADCDFTEGYHLVKSHTDHFQDKKIMEIVKNNNFDIHQFADLYIMAYYGCTESEVIQMITRIKRERYVNDLEGFFEKRLYAKELAEDIAENTRYYQEYFEQYGEEHPDLIPDRKKF
jgi:hypothetical protein